MDGMVVAFRGYSGHPGRKAPPGAKQRPGKPSAKAPTAAPKSWPIESLHVAGNRVVSEKQYSCGRRA